MKSSIALLFLLGGTAAVHADEWPFYVGAGLGQARGEVDAAAMDARMAALGYSADAEVRHLNRLAWQGVAGYAVSDYLAVELGYVDLGEVNTHLSGDTDDIQAYLTGADVVHPRSADGWQLGARVRWPVTGTVGVFARGGLLWADSDYHAYTVDGSASAERSHRQRETFWGLGADYRVAERWEARLDWARYDIEGESIDLLTLGVSYHFALF